MKAHPTIGIISPGDMGHAIGAVLVVPSLYWLLTLFQRGDGDLPDTFTEAG